MVFHGIVVWVSLQAVKGVATTDTLPFVRFRILAELAKSCNRKILTETLLTSMRMSVRSDFSLTRFGEQVAMFAAGIACRPPRGFSPTLLKTSPRHELAPPFG